VEPLHTSTPQWSLFTLALHSGAQWKVTYTVAAQNTYTPQTQPSILLHYIIQPFTVGTLTFLKGMFVTVFVVAKTYSGIQLRTASDTKPNNENTLQAKHSAQMCQTNTLFV